MMVIAKTRPSSRGGAPIAATSWSRSPTGSDRDRAERSSSPPAGKARGDQLATIDFSIALCLALTINASSPILATATCHRAAKTDVAGLDQAHAFLAPPRGSTLAPTLFAIALLCCGLNSTITATLSGQIVMEGFLNWRIAPGCGGW